jgi:hypothetical protein
MTNIASFINSLSNKSANNIRSEIYKFGVCANYEQNENRMIFYTDKKNRYKSISPLQLECNGLVFDLQNMRPLVIPQLSFKSNLHVPTVNSFLNQNLYDIYYIDDGSILNLYYYNNTWVLASNRSYDIANKKWGRFTYYDMFNSIVPAGFYELLDVNCCYTFGMKHATIHPLEQKNKVWFIQSTNLTTHIVSYTFNNNIVGVDTQQPYTRKIKSVTELFSLLQNSLNKYLNNKDALYGFLLVSRNKDLTGENSNLLLESSLLQKLRNVYYNSKFKKLSDENNYERSKLIVLYNFLDYNNSGIFTRLFPQFNNYITQCKNITEYLVNSIINFDKLTPEYTNYKQVKILHNALKSKYSFNDNEKEIVKSFVMSLSWINLYYEMFNASDII